MGISSGTRGNSSLSPSYTHPIHPGSLYFPAGLLTPHHSGCTRNSQYLLPSHHFRTGHPGLLTLGILSGVQSWALGSFFLLLLVLSLLSHPNCCPCCHCCVSQSDPPKEMMSWVKQSPLMRNIMVRQSLTPGHPSGHPLATKHTMASFLDRDLWLWQVPVDPRSSPIYYIRVSGT